MEIKNINDGINWRTIPKVIKDEFLKNGHLRKETHRRNDKGTMDVTYGEIMRPMFVHYNYDLLNFFVNLKFAERFDEQLDLEIIFDENLNLITRKNIKPFFDEYSSGFKKGYSEFEDTSKKYVPLFGTSNESIAYKVYSRIINDKKGSFPMYSTFNFKKSDLEMEIHKERNLKVLYKLNKESFFNSGFEGGEFYKAWEIILNNPSVFEPIFTKHSKSKPEQLEPEPLNLPHSTENASETINKVKSPQDKIESYLYNEINIELYDDFSFIYKEDKELLKFFNKIFWEFDFFLNNKDNYLEIVNHFVYDELGYLFWDDEIYFNPKTESNKLFELFNLYECLTRLIKYNYPESNRIGALIKTCEHIEKLYKKIQKLYLPELYKEENIKTYPKQTEPDNSTIEKIIFKNEFNKVSENDVLEYFTKKLVEKEYLTKEALSVYLKQAFELKTPPKKKFTFKNIDSIENIVKVFYKFYKDVTTESTYGKQPAYFNLLKNYFTGFENIHINNFSK